MISSEDKQFSIRLEQAIEYKTRRVKRLHRIKVLAQYDEWAALKEELESSAKTCEDFNLATLEDTSEPKIDPVAQLIALKARAREARAFRSIIFIVEAADERVRTLNEEIAEHRQKLRAIQDKASSPETSSHHPRRSTV